MTAAETAVRITRPHKNAELIADVTMGSGVVLIDEFYGRDALVRHLARLAVTAFDPKADMSAAPKFLQ